MNNIYLLLGANLGSPIEQLYEAERMLHKTLGQIVASSSIYESEAWGIEDQPIFYNQVLHITTRFDPFKSLKICQGIENKLGRIRKKKWGARIIDIDILYFNDEIIKTDNLIIPHPFLHLRNFNLIPLNEIAEDYIHPVLNYSNKELLAQSSDRLNVTKFIKNEL